MPDSPNKVPGAITIELVVHSRTDTVTFDGDL